MEGKDRYVVVPLTLQAANAFVAKYHRHNKPTAGHKFSIGLTLDGTLIGVGIAGRPVSRHLDDGMTLELTRVCVAPGHQNACSKLLGRLKQIGQLMGYARIKTYTLLDESGASLRAVGAIPERHCPPSRWDRPGSSWQPVYEKEKTRWELLAHKEQGACERSPPSSRRGACPKPLSRSASRLRPLPPSTLERTP